jgi:SAM-dependent methyltransferase
MLVRFGNICQIISKCWFSIVRKNRSLSSLDAEKVDKYWSKKGKYAPNWYAFCAAYINESISGMTDLSPTPWVWQQFFQSTPVEAALEIGCLNGKKLLGLLSEKMVLRCYGVDIARGAIDEAKRLAREKRLDDKIHFSIMDLNESSLAPEAYNWIISNGVLHHISNLEVCIKNIYDSLLPGGYLSASEFTGPSRYQYSQEEVDFINEARSMLPVELGGNTLFDPAELRSKLNADPSEAIRSDDINEILNRTFDKLIVKSYGGNILMRALGQDFFKNYNSDKHSHTTAFLKLIDFERELLKSSIKSHHAFFVGYKME